MIPFFEKPLGGLEKSMQYLFKAALNEAAS